MDTMQIFRTAGQEYEIVDAAARKRIEALSEGSTYNIGHGLKLESSTMTLSVDVAEAVEADNTNPISSAAVHVEIGNIEILLATI